MHQNLSLNCLRYEFENTLARGTIALIGWLALASLAFVLTLTGIVWVLGAQPEGFDVLAVLWDVLLHALAADPIDVHVGPWPYLLVMLATTLGSIFLISILIGVLTTGIEGQIESLRKGRSRVLETGHTVILGWSPQIFTLLSELVVANANQPRPRIVILGDKDKVEMEDEIRDRVGHTGRTRIICRTGNPIELNDLDIVNVHAARSIIIPGTGVDPDSQVIKSLLAIVNHPHRRPQPYHIVAEIRDPQNVEVARLVGRDEGELVQAGDLVARIMAQTCRQSGLSVVYTELLDFSGDEIYFQAEPGLVGQTFGDALLAYEDSAVIGLQSAGGRVALNPPMDTVIQPGDQIIAISADDDAIRLSGLTDLGINSAVIQTAASTPPTPERTLILGWNWRVPAIINELDAYVAPGSTVTVVADYANGEAVISQCCDGIRNQSVAFLPGDTTHRRTLDSLRIETYQHVIILCYSDTLDTQQADARTLITLLHLRDIARRTGQPFSIVSEMLDVRNRDLAEVARADDFIVSDKIVSLMLAQVAENKALNAVFADLFDPEGSEIYLKPAAHYVRLGEPVNFYTVVEAARWRGETAIGYRLAALANDAARSYGVTVNPRKSRPITFGGLDRVIVLATE